MMNPELYILALFQRLSDKVQEYTGFTNFHLARLVMFFRATVIILLGPISLLASKEVMATTVVIEVVFRAIMLFIVAMLYNLIRKIELFCKNKPEYRNPLEIKGGVIRMFLWMFLIFAIGDVVHVYKIYNAGNDWKMYWYFMYYVGEFANTFFFLCYGYFISCTPRPPRTSKIEKWTKRISEWFSHKPVFAPVSHVVK